MKKVLLVLLLLLLFPAVIVYSLRPEGRQELKKKIENFLEKKESLTLDEGDNPFYESPSQEQAAEVTTGQTTDSEQSEADEPQDTGNESQKININDATVEQLQAIPGVGADLAEKIIEDRTKNGAFSRIDDLQRVTGIGEKKAEQMKGSIEIHK